MTGPTCFLLQLELIWLAVLSSNYWLYDFNDTRFQFFFFLLFFLDIFVLLVTFELLSQFPNVLHIIKKNFSPIGVDRTFSASQICLSGKS